MNLPAAAARYLQGFQRRADAAAAAYERGINLSIEGRMSQADRELKFRLEQSR